MYSYHCVFLFCFLSFESAVAFLVFLLTALLLCIGIADCIFVTLEIDKRLCTEAGSFVPQTTVKNCGKTMNQMMNQEKRITPLRRAENKNETKLHVSCLTT